MPMKLGLLAASGAALMMAFATTPIFAAENMNSNTSAHLAQLLNNASKMNHEEINIADMVKNKSGDNEALNTMAQTIKDDHQANQDAVKNLANAKNVNLNSADDQKTEAENKLSNLNGDAFVRAFLMDTIRDHRKELQKFQQARSETTDPAVREYIDETTPVLESHLKMAENLHRDMTEGTTQSNNENMNSNSQNSQNDNGEETSSR